MAGTFQSVGSGGGFSTDSSGNATASGAVISDPGPPNTHMGIIRIGGPAASNGVTIANSGTGILYFRGGDNNALTRFLATRMSDTGGNGITCGNVTTVTSGGGQNAMQFDASGNCVARNSVMGPYVQVGSTTGPSIRGGPAAPTGSTVGINGDLYLNTSGTTGTRLYVCTGGSGPSSYTWSAVSGV